MMLKLAFFSIALISGLMYIFGISALHLVSYFGSKDLAFILMDNGFDVNSAVSIYGWTPLMVAASTGNHNIVSMLIKHGAAVNKYIKVGGYRKYI